MSGIYLHIPFCKQACNYCNFHFSTSLRNKNDFVAALLKEIELRKDYLENELVETVYFGGGTPSLLTIEELALIQNQLAKTFSLSEKTEMTLEANPDDISVDKLKSWKSVGINRLSIGVQSFFEEDLIWMNRAHNAKQAMTSISDAQQTGFENITIDLIYGTPTLNNEKWAENLSRAASLKIPHLSCYALTVEPKTFLDKLIKQKKVADINTDVQAEQFLMLIDFAKSNGYEHYEISNFAVKGKRSRHNSSYWQGKKYLGLGPSAHSYNGTERSWNIANNQTYIHSLKDNQLAFEKETLSKTQRLNEYIMISLRTMEGCDLSYIENNFGEKIKDGIFKEAQHYIKDGHIKLTGERLVLTNSGKLLADGIAADLFSEEEKD